MREDSAMALGHGLRGPVRIVIADDDRLFAGMLRAQLSNRPGFEVVGLAANGAEAVHLAQELEPDVVLMDVAMPELDGIEPARLTRAASDPPAVVLITGADEESDARAYQAGAAPDLRKSADLVPLMDVMVAVSLAAPAA